MPCSGWNNYPRMTAKSSVERAELERFLTQPFFATEQFSGISGKDVSLKDALDGCERILKDEFKDYPESAFYMIGAIDEAKEKAKTAKPTVTPNSASRPQSPPAVKAKTTVEQGLAAINLKVLLPFQVFLETQGVKSIVACTLQGSSGILPHRLDYGCGTATGDSDVRNRSGRRRLSGRRSRGVGQDGTGCSHFGA